MKDKTTAALLAFFLGGIGVPKDVASEIERLHGLKEKGIITQTEFEDAKRKLL